MAVLNILFEVYLPVFVFFCHYLFYFIWFCCFELIILQ